MVATVVLCSVCAATIGGEMAEAILIYRGNAQITLWRCQACVTAGRTTEARELILHSAPSAGKGESHGHDS